jgi:hypothetical protein
MLACVALPNGRASDTLLAAIFQWLWNITMPEAFGLRPIRFWIAFRLLLIAAFLASGSLIKLNLG